MNRKIVISLIVIVIALGLVVLNKSLNVPNNPSPEQVKAAQQQQQQQPPAPLPNSSASSGLDGETLIGRPGGKQNVIIAYTWTPKLQAQPQGLTSIQKFAQGWVQKTGNYVQLLCVDIPVDERDTRFDPNLQPGVYVTGPSKQSLAGNPGDDLKSDQVIALLKSLKP